LQDTSASGYGCNGSMDPRVIAISGASRGSVFRLAEGRISIGSDPSNYLRIPEMTVSPRHCVIKQVDSGCEIVDLDSQHGTFVNGIPVREKTLLHGDMIRVGRCEMVFLAMEEAQGAAAIEYSEPVPGERLKMILLQDQTAPPQLGTDVGRMARDLNALFKISKTINSLQDLKALQSHLLQLIFEVIPAETGAILIINQIEQDPVSISTWDRQLGEGRHVKVQRELISRAIWERSAVLGEPTEDAPHVENVLCVPLIALQKTIGVIYLVSSLPSQRFEEDHVHFLNSVAGVAAVTLENVLTLEALRDENRRLRLELSPRDTIIGESKPMRQLMGLISKVAQGDSTALVRGESGTGKELVALAIHRNSARADKPFVAINCAAIPETLLESELFGHEKGAFTGAVAIKRGKLEVAESGSVFLDEIGELAPALQAKLLRVLQQKEFERLGGTHPIKFEARVIAATNKNLEQAIKAGEFRQDLFYRLNVVSVTVPPLRDHRDDIPLLAIYFATRFASRCTHAFRGISAEARSLLMNYSWPGNIRELENAIEHAIVMGSSAEILPEDLPEALLEGRPVTRSGANYHDEINELKRRLILDAMNEAKGNYTDAARLLGVHANYLHRLVRNLDLRTDLKRMNYE